VSKEQQEPKVLLEEELAQVLQDHKELQVNKE
jgi:hypothetical protein